MAIRRPQNLASDEDMPFGLVVALIVLVVLTSFAAGSWLGWISRAFF